MTPWLALSLGLWLGQTPVPGPVTPLPETDDLDPATRELRDAREAAQDEVDTTGTTTDQGLTTAPGRTADVGLPGDTRTGPGPETTAPAASGAASDTDPGVGFGGSGTAPAGNAPPPPGATAPAPGQTATGTEESQDETNRVPSMSEMSRELGRLQSRVQELEAQAQTRAEQSTTQLQSLQGELNTMRERAAEQELLRVERLEQLDRAAEWLVAADQALFVGELGIGEALEQADAALADAQGNAERSGHGETVLLMESARARLVTALEATGERNVDVARLQIHAASQELRAARMRALDRPDTTVLTQ
jgi:hypothetical protein